MLLWVGCLHGCVHSLPDSSAFFMGGRCLLASIAWTPKHILEPDDQ